MKKFFSLFAAVLFASSMMAGSVTFSGADFTGGTPDTGSAFSVTKNGVTVSATRAYGTGSELRVYGPNTQEGLEAGVLSVSAGDVKITKITPVFGQNTKMTFEEATPNATSWSVEATKQIRLSSLTVEIEGESGTSEGGEGEGGGSGEEGDEVVISGLAAADAYFYNVSGENYWDIDLYKEYDWDNEAVVYPEVYLVIPAASATALTGEYALNYAGYWKSAKDSVEISDDDEDGYLKITFDGDNYHFVGQFLGENGKTYKFSATVAYDDVYSVDVTDEDNPQSIDLDDEVTQGIEDIVLTEKAQKVVVDGAVYVIRDNKMYNVTGTRVR